MNLDERTLVVVADGRRAEIFEEARRGGPLEPWPDALSAMTVPGTGHGPGPGRVYDRAGHAFHGVTSESPHDAAERHFVTALAKHFDTLHRERPFDGLVIIAPPKALGVLRKALSPAMKHRLRASEAKEITGATASVVRTTLHDLRLARS